MRWIATGILALALLGCSGKTTRDETGATRELTISDIRLLASELATPGQDGWEESREPLKSVMWNRGIGAELRLVALDALLTHDEPDTISMLWYLIPSETDWVVLGAISLEAQTRSWLELDAPLVRSLRREVAEPAFEHRPEYRALIAMHPESTIEEIVYGVFADESLDSDLGVRARQDAWSLLTRLDPDHDRVIELLASSEATDDPLMGDLQAASEDLGVLASTPEQLRWLAQMREQEHASFWLRASEVVAHLEGEQREDLELGHLAILVRAHETHSHLFGMDRVGLLEELHARLDGRRVLERRVGDTFAHPELLETWEDELPWASLASLVVLDDILREAGMLGSFFEQARADRGDTTTEHGGLLEAVDGTIRLRRFVPRPSQRRGDATYIAPPEMMVASTEALAMYHFHANALQNSDRAGPSEADLAFARESGRVCVVLTSARRGRLDIDVYFPDGAMIDLGVVESS
ncbi:MAG: hypothetical protein ACYTF7_04525 [Planctomycetota bacterium]|jgi:hypothetical protein